MVETRFFRAWPALGLAFLLLAASGCSIRKMAVNMLADALAGGGGEVFTSDDDPELVGDALPFALKTYETLLAESPENKGLLIATCKGFTLYSNAYVARDLERLELDDYRHYKHQRERSLKLYLRARDYCLRALELTVPGTTEALQRDPGNAGLERFEKGDVEVLLWSGLSWGAAISAGLDRPELVVDAPAIRALVERALELDPDFDHGRVHETMMVLESLPEELGGSVERARRHYERALELAGGERASVYVNWASQVSVRQQDREEFESLLKKALEIDPEKVPPSERLLTLITQERARLLLDLADDLFI